MLYLDRALICHTVERPWKDNIRWESCIPEGEYNIRIRNGAKEGSRFKYLHIAVLRVPDRSHILIHAANKPSDVTGCIAPGLRGDTRNWVSGSMATLNELILSLAPMGRTGTLTVARLDTSIPFGDDHAA